MAKKKQKEKTPSSEKKSFKTKESTNTFPFVCTVITLGIIFRLVQPFFNNTISPDELVLISDLMNKEFWGLFNPLSSTQTAPPLFLCLIKTFTYLIPTGSSQQVIDNVCRTIPLVASIASVFVFHQLLKNIFINKFVILTGLILFSLNPALINYAYTLKPFSTDVLICTLLILYFIRYNPEGYWKQFLQILIISCSILFSLPAGFIVFSGVINILFKDWRKFLFAITAFGLFGIFYFIYHLWGIMEAHGAGLDSYWQNFFITTQNTYHLALNLIKTNFNLFLSPAIGLGILGAGLLISCFRDKKIAILTTFTTLVILLTSYLHLYPFAPRLLLFTIPFAIILVCEICDIIPSNNIISKVLPIIFVGLACFNLLTTIF